MIVAIALSNYPDFNLNSVQVFFDDARSGANPVTFEAGCRDQGAVAAGLNDAFAIDRLCIVTSNVRLLDDYQNQNGDEVVYVRTFGLSVGSTLNLNGKKLFYLNEDLPCSNGIRGTVNLQGGELTQIRQAEN